jgi:hypothetical protein
MLRHYPHFKSAMLALLLAGVAMPPPAAAQNFFDFLFNGGKLQPPQRQQRQAEPPAAANLFADPFGLNPQPAPPPRPVSSGSGGGGPAFCVRSCDGRYFPLMVRAGASPAQMCQSFCPASVTKVFFGSNIDGASSSKGERYADSDNAFAYRKALKPDCTCNGRSSAGLAPFDLPFDRSLKAGDVVATANGLVAYSGVRLGAGQTPEFTPVASFPGLTADVRAKLGEMKVAPVTAELVDSPKPIEAEPQPAVAAKPAAPAKSPMRAEVR